MLKKTISILGSTGSIGTQALRVIRALGWSVCALANKHDIILLEEQIREFQPKIAVVFDEIEAKKLKIAVADIPVKILSGMSGLCEAATEESADIVLNAVVGMIGLQPTLAAISAHKDVALANKETLVVGGVLVKEAAQKNAVKILPVDSEHSAIFQCLQGAPESKDLNRLILTASGGPFFGKKTEELRLVTPKEALKHPNWDMGAKITIDSASMMNKGLELIEASWLFDMPPEKIDIVIHRESIIHSLIEYVDYSVIAQLGVPDMAIPIQYALTYPQRLPSPAKQLSLTEIGKLSFFEADEETFICLKACKEAIQRGGLAPTAVNGANEEAVALFLKEKISFTDIGDLVMKAMENEKGTTISSIENILEADRRARDFVLTATV